MHLEESSIGDLKTRVRNRKPQYVGATDNYIRREQQHRSNYPERYKMYYAETTNMQHAENRLLQICAEREGCRSNVQGTSNAAEARGFVYAIFSRSVPV